MRGRSVGMRETPPHPTPLPLKGAREGRRNAIQNFNTVISLRHGIGYEAIAEVLMLIRIRCRNKLLTNRSQRYIRRLTHA